MTRRLRTLMSLSAREVRSTLGRPDYWHLEAPIGCHIDPAEPRGYYLDYSSRVEYPGSTDASGVPIHSSEGGRPVRHPPDVAQFALGSLELYLETGDERWRRPFEAAVDVLLEEAREAPGGSLSWAMASAPAVLAGSLGSPWFSAMAHGECVSVLVRAGRLFGRDDALASASRAVPFLATPVEGGGVLRDAARFAAVPGDGVFLEEYPMRGRPSLVLNGHVHALWGIHDHAAATGEASSRELLERSVNGLRMLLPRFDLGFWTRYDLDEAWRGINVSSPFYHRIHVRQLTIVHRLTGDDLFLETARRWQAYLDRPWNRARGTLGKARFKLANPGSAVA
jgi:hypothetical protein